MTDLKLQNVWFSYEDRTVLENVSLTFPAGRTTILMGPSGIGKTTVFRLISGLEKPQEDRLQGSRKTEPAFYFRRIGYSRN